MQRVSGAFRLFRLAGIDVYLHWSWLLIAFYELRFRDGDDGPGRYISPVWNVVEYLSLFGIVLLHEFGHALACRSVGGRADTIVLWPLGGVAYVQPPPRPGPMLWSIAAGPLVNVLLVPVTVGAWLVAGASGWEQARPDVYQFCLAMTFINGGLLCFNVLPIYPLDGGQIVQALLWFVLGRARSLLIASVIGLVGCAGLVGLALLGHNLWLGLMAAFLAYRAWMGFQQARLLSEVLRAPRHEDALCPSCGEAPFRGDYWGCPECRLCFDTFHYGGHCPQCGQEFSTTSCPLCHRSYPIADWYAAAKARGASRDVEAPAEDPEAFRS